MYKRQGKRTAKLHEVDKFDYFGDIQLEKQSPVQAYKKFAIEDCERLIENLYKQNLNQIDVISNSIDKLRNEYEHIRDLKQGRYSHRDLDGRNRLIKITQICIRDRPSGKSQVCKTFIHQFKSGLRLHFLIICNTRS